MSFCEYPTSFPSVCIPRVTGRITERVVWDIFHSLRLGDIDHIDMMWNAGKKDTRVIIHWKFWNVNRNAQETRQRLLNGGEFRAFYHPDKFWKVYQYMPQGRRHPSVKDAREEEERQKRKAREEEEERQKRKAREEEERQQRKAREEKKKHKEEREELTREELYAIEVSYQVMINTIQVEPPPTNRAAEKLKALTPGFNRQSKSKLSNILITALHEMPSIDPFSNALFWLKKEESDDPHRQTRLEMLIEKLAISQQLLMDASAELHRLIES
jgi:flagellar biosynthesis GTPase FlhF